MTHFSHDCSWYGSRLDSGDLRGRLSKLSFFYDLDANLSAFLFSAEIYAVSFA